MTLHSLCSGLLLLLLGDLFRVLLGLLDLLIGILLGLLLVVLELLRISLLLCFELFLLGLRLCVVGGLFRGIGGNGGLDLVSGWGQWCSGHSSLFGTASGLLLSATRTSHAIVKLLEHLGHSLRISRGSDVVEAIIGLERNVVLVILGRDVLYNGGLDSGRSDPGSWNDSLDGLLAHDVGGKGVNLTEMIIVQL